MVLISGPTGSGKTTLMEFLYAAEIADSGTVEMFGRDVAKLRRSSLALLRKHIGVVPQRLALLDDRSALHNVALALEICAEPRQTMHTRAAEALGRVGLACEVDTPVHELSTGQKQLVAVARALVREPDILVADEPSTYLDETGREALMTLLDEGSRRGAAAVVATNDHKLLGAGAHFGWRHMELHEGILRMIADRKPMHDIGAGDGDTASDYESYELEVEDNVVPFPLVAHAGGFAE